MTFDWSAPDGHCFPCLHWIPDSSPRGILICVHGLGGAASDFIPLGETVAKAGFACFAQNLRGQGLDPLPMQRGAYLDLAVIISDIEAFVRDTQKKFPAVPLFLCGESMGALIIASMVANRCSFADLKGVIFSAPVVELIKPTPWPIRQVVRFIAALTPNIRFYPAWFISGKCEPLKVTRDEAYQKQIQTAPHSINAFTFHFLNALGNLIQSSSAQAKYISLPCLVLAAGCDVFLRPEQVRSWFDQLASKDKIFRLYPEAYHLLWNDWDRQIVLRDILDWLDNQLTSCVPGS